MSEGNEPLRALGRSETRYDYDEPRPDLLERIPNPAADAGANPAGAALALRIDVPEFSCLCPITAQPDWARVSYRAPRPMTTERAKVSKPGIGSQTTRTPFGRVWSEAANQTPAN